MRYYFSFANQGELLRAQQRLHAEHLSNLYELDGMGFGNVAHIVVDTPAIAGLFCQKFVAVPLKFRFGWVGEESSSDSESDSGPDLSEGSGYVSSPPQSPHYDHPPLDREE